MKSRRPILPVLLVLALGLGVTPTRAGGESKASKDSLPENQTLPEALKKRPKGLSKGFRIGMVLFPELYLKPFRSAPEGSNLVYGADLLGGLELSWHYRLASFALTAAPAGFRMQSDRWGREAWDPNVFLGHGVFASLQIKGVFFQIGLPDYKWDADGCFLERFRWKETSFGASFAILRFPSWEGIKFLPEFRGK